MFSKKKRRPLISEPSNFEHRVHTGFDDEEGQFTGLPFQWQSILPDKARPKPFVDASAITPVEAVSDEVWYPGFKRQNLNAIFPKLHVFTFCTFSM